MRILRRSLSLCLSLLALAAIAWPQAATAETLEEALSSAYRTNPQLKAARRELGAVNENVPQELANWRPEVSVQGSAGRQRVESESGFSGSGLSGFGGSNDYTSSPWSTAIELRQPLYRGGRTVAGTSRAENEVRAQRARLAATEQDVLFRAAQAYMDVWRDQSVLELNRNNVEVLRRQLEATQDRFDVGEVTRTDVAQAESRLSRAIADRIAAEGALEASRAAYKEVIGHPPEDLEQPPVPDVVPEGRDNVVGQALQSNPDVVAAGYAEQAARDRVRQVAGELLPQADLVGRLSHQENSSGSDSETQAAEIVAEVTVPLYQQGAVFSRVRQSKQTANQRRLEVRSAERTAEQNAISAWEDLLAARAQIDSFEEQVRAADIALEGVRQEHQVGARTVLDVLNAEQELLNAQVDLVRAQRNEIVASYDVLAAVGKLEAGTIGLPVEVYDPKAPYDKVRDKLWGWGLPSEDDADAAAKSE